MIVLTDGQTASWTVTTAEKPIYHVQVMVTAAVVPLLNQYDYGTFSVPAGDDADFGTFAEPSGPILDFNDLLGASGVGELEATDQALWIANVAGSHVAVQPSGGSEVGEAGTLLIERFDPPLLGDVKVHIHVRDLLRAHPGDGLKTVLVTVVYADGTNNVYEQLIMVDTSPSTAYAFYARAGEYGGYLRYYDAAADAQRVRLTWPNGAAAERALPTPVQGLVWLPGAPSDAAPVSARLLDVAGNETQNILAGSRVGTPEIPNTELIPWAVPPYIEPLGVGFGAIYRAVERTLNLGPDAAGIAVDPRTTFGSYLEVLASVFGLQRLPDERDEELRVRVFAALQQGKATPEGLTAILTAIYNVPVQVIDYNIDPTVEPGTFLVYLFAVPTQGLDGAAQIVRNYRAAGLPPTLTLTLRADPTPTSPRWLGAHRHMLLTTHLLGLLGRNYYIDATWHLDNTIPLGAWSMTRWSQEILDSESLAGAPYTLSDGETMLTDTSGRPYTTTDEPD